jgi:hypothetical protein
MVRYMIHLFKRIVLRIIDRMYSEHCWYRYFECSVHGLILARLTFILFQLLDKLLMFSEFS